MKKIFALKNIGCGYLYFYIHMITEIACFYFLANTTYGIAAIWLVPFVYDALAFVPQSLIGYYSDKHPNIDLSLIGIILLLIAYLIFFYTELDVFVPLIILCLGNCLIHVRGAEVTLKNSNGKLSHSSIFVAGGSFGVVIGKLLKGIVPPYIIMILILTAIPFILYAETYKESKAKPNCNNFNFLNKSINKYLIIILAVLVVIVRGYMGYGIPTSWKKTTLELIIFYFTMGLGKAFGGILSDRFGIRKIAIISTLCSIPLLCFGDNIMILSLLGVMLFSMTMSITLGILVSALKKSPGLAFGLTTIGLFLGTAPIFFFTITSKMLNIIVIAVFSVLCSIALGWILKENNNG